MPDDEMPNGPAPVEPSASLREFASNLQQMYVALTATGFTEDQALRIIGYTLKGAFGSSND